MPTNGTLGGDPKWVEGIMDGALELTSDYVAIDGVVNDMTSTNITPVGLDQDHTELRGQRIRRQR